MKLKGEYQYFFSLHYLLLDAKFERNELKQTIIRKMINREFQKMLIRAKQL